MGDKIMTNLVFKTEITIDDKYRGEVDIPVEVYSHVREEQDMYMTGDSPKELFIELESVLCTDPREFSYAEELVSRLDQNTAEYLKDIAASKF